MADKKGPLCRLHRLTLVYPKGRLCWFIFLSLSHTMLTYYRNFTATTHITMSGQLASFVSILDGSNYLEWARLLEAYFVTDGPLRTSSYLHGLPLGPFPFLSTTFHSHAYCTITCLLPLSRFVLWTAVSVSC